MLLWKQMAVRTCACKLNRQNTMSQPVLFLTLCLVAASSALAGTTDSGSCAFTTGTACPPGASSRLSFKNGKFRIMQVADVHYQNGATTGCQDIEDFQNPCSDLNSTAFMQDVLTRETPDLVAFTGDNIWYNGNTDIVKHQAELTQPVNDAQIPYFLTFGNHDCEDQPCRKTLIAADMKQPYSLTQQGPSALHGEANYAYVVNGQNGKPKLALYVFDSGAYETLGGKVPNSYDWVRADQVEWYNQTSRALKAQAGQTVPAIAFLHIPIPEYDTAFVCNANPNNVSDGSVKDFGPLSTRSGMGKSISTGCQGTQITGVHQEGVYSGAVNGGLFSAFIENGDVRMVNVGHDHINDYCATMYGVRLCYGGGFGYHAYGKKGWPRRSRIIDVNEDGTISTYKVLDKWGNFAHVDAEKF